MPAANFHAQCISREGDAGGERSDTDESGRWAQHGQSRNHAYVTRSDMAPHFSKSKEKHENEWRKRQTNVGWLGKKSAECGNRQNVILIGRLSEISQRETNLEAYTCGH